MGCSSLDEININNFNTHTVFAMNRMFSDCGSLKRLDLSNLDTTNVIYMKFMFYKCPYKLQMKIKSQYKNIMEEAFE